jgi:hypothetical protein
MILLTDSAKVWFNGKFETFKLYKAGSAEKHAASDDTTLKTELIKALNTAKPGLTQDQGGGVFRYKINDGKGYIVYKLGVSGTNSAAIFHYHWNYTMDLPLTAL